MNTDTDCDNPQSLHKRTLALVRAEPRGLLAVHTKTGVPYHWLRKFAAGRIPNPGVNRVQKLFEKLSGKTVKL